MPRLWRPDHRISSLIQLPTTRSCASILISTETWRGALAPFDVQRTGHQFKQTLEVADQLQLNDLVVIISLAAAIFVAITREDLPRARMEER